MSTKPKIVFIIPAITDAHYRCRVLDFIKCGYQTDVYAFMREGRPAPSNIPYDYQSLGTLRDEGYKSRVSLYIKQFRRLKKQYRGQQVIYFLGGLDIAMFFRLVNPCAEYIYEECDLVHTYTRLKQPLEMVDKYILRHARAVITTSEGFIRYHFGDKKPSNIFLVENKLNPEVLNVALKPKHEFDPEHLSIGFVGRPRFDSVYNFIEVYCRRFPQHTFHIFGGPVEEQFEQLRKYSNCIFHGFFKSPADLGDIYSQLDLVVSTYDICFDNVRYAEPNKIYESIYFETPIIVSTGTFLADKVNRLGIGYDIDALNEQQVVDFIEHINAESISQRQQAARDIGKNYTLCSSSYPEEVLA